MSSPQPNPHAPRPAAAHHARWIAHAAALACALVWSAAFALIKLARDELGAVSLGLLRYDLAAVAVAITWIWRRPRVTGLGTRGWCFMFFLAAMTGPLYQILQNVGAAGTSSGLMAMLVATVPLHVPWLAAVILRERLTIVSATALGLGIAGVSIPIVAGGDLSFTTIAYPGLIALAALIGALSTVLARRIRHRLEPWDMMCLVCVLAAVAGLPLTTAHTLREWTELSWTGWAAAVYLAIPGTVICLALWYAALRRLDATTVTFHMFVMMIVAALWGWIIHDEPFDWPDRAAVLLVFAGLIVNSRK